MTDKTFSRRRLLKTVGLLSTAGTIGAVAVTTKSNSADADSSSQFDNHFDSPLGAWFLIVTPNPPPGVPQPLPDRVLTVINAGGSVVETDLAYLKANPGMGAWVRTGKYTFKYTLFKESVNPDGTYSGAEHINQKNVLNETFDQFSGQSFVTILDANGNVTAHATANIQASRIKVDPNTYPA